MRSLCATALLAVFCLLLAGHSSRAQTFIAGVPVYCSDFRGLPVTAVPNPTLNDIGLSTIGPGGQPIIVLNPNILFQLPREMQLFWYAHECGHHVLGHVARPSLTNEAAADCWAVKTGKHQGWFPPQAFQGLIQELGNSPGDWSGHLPGPARIQNMWACYQSS